MVRGNIDNEEKKIEETEMKKECITISYPKQNGNSLDKRGRGMHFTTLDLFKGFHQIEVQPGDNS